MNTRPRSSVSALLRGSIVALTLGCADRAEQPIASAARAGAANDHAPAILLNEVRYLPRPGEHAFVELRNTGTAAASLEQSTLENERGQRFQFPKGATIEAGGLTLVAFDGGSGIDGRTVHAGGAEFLASPSGSITLRTGEAVLDEVQWSEDGGSAYVQPRGGHIARTRPGSVIARPPDNISRSPMPWTTYGPQEATPGAPNPYPRVTGLLPLPGAILREPRPALTWYTVASATRYRVQVAKNRTFADPLFDQWVDAEAEGVTTRSATPGALAPGAYFWRVQAAFAKGEAPYSDPAALWIVAPGRVSLNGWEIIPSAYAETIPEPIHKVLPVPFIPQRKDTRLLALEAKETGPKPWDAPWAPRSGPYCARASIAMVAAFFGGDVSQDRITHEAFKNFKPGPIFDIFTNNGFSSRNIRDGIAWSMGVSPPRMSFSETHTRIQYFNQFKEEIDRGKPIIATSEVHVWVVVGYGTDERGSYLVINDPGLGQYDYLVLPRPGVLDADMESPAVSDMMTENYFFPGTPRGRSDEPEVKMDSDGDGVMDWDETQRFNTSPRNKDSDGDQVPDKQDIRSWVFDDVLGWALTYPARTALDIDRDDKWVHVDEDSDNGGCIDGLEDLDRDGKRKRTGETWVFDKGDDPCISGTYSMVTDEVDGRSRNHFRHTATISLKPKEDGTIEGAAIETWQIVEIIDWDEQRNCAAGVTHDEPITFTTPLKGRVAPQADGSVMLMLEMNYDPAARQQYTTRVTQHCDPLTGTATVPVPFLPIGPVPFVNGEYKHEQTIPPNRGTGGTTIKYELKQNRPPALRQ